MRTIEPIRQTVPPAPTGDAFDDLWLDCCDAVVRHPKLKGKASAFSPRETRPDGVIVKHSDDLGDEVTVWIQQGDLRCRTQVNDAIKAYADHWDRLITMGAVKDWKLEQYSYWNSIRNLRWFFGVQGAKPLPSKQDVLDEKARWEAAESERIRLTNIARREDKEREAKWEAEFELKERIDKLVKRISAKLYSFDKIDFEKVGDIPDPRYLDLLEKRRKFRIARIEVKSRIEQGKTDEEIMEEMIMEMIEMFNYDGESAVPPLAEGQTRRFFTDFELAKFMSSGDWEQLLDEYDTVLMKGSDDGLWVLDTAAKTKETV
jgi:hypothetical protein